MLIWRIHFIYTGLLAFIGGVWVWFLEFRFSGATTLILFLLIGGAGVIWRRYKSIVLWIFTLSIFILANFYTGIRQNLLTTNPLEHYLNQTVSVKGLVVQKPVFKQYYQNLTLKLDALLTPTGWQSVSGKILIKIPPTWSLEYGDCLEMKLKLESIENQNYLIQRGIYAQSQYPSQLKVTNQKKIFLLSKWLYQLRKQLDQNIEFILPFPDSALLRGILLGEKEGLSVQIVTDFWRTGLAHIVALSGTNISYILAFITALFGFMPKKWRFGLSALCIILFVMMVDTETSVIRAAVLGILGMWAILEQRLAQSFLLLLWVAVGMLIFNPGFLAYDLGFQLSFLAVLGLIFVGPALSKILPLKYKYPYLRQILITTLAAQIAVLPWVLHQFGQLALVAPLANLVAAPVIPLAMLLGTLASLIAFIWIKLGIFCGFFADLCLKFILLLSHSLANLTFFGTAELKSFPLFLVLVFYGIIIGGILLINKKHKG